MYGYSCLTLLLLLGSCRAGFNMKAPSAAVQAQVLSCEDALYNGFCSFKTQTESGDCQGAKDAFGTIQATSCAETSPVTPLRIFRGLRYARQFAWRCPRIGFPVDGCRPAFCTNRVFTRSGDQFKCSIGAKNRAQYCYNFYANNGCSFASVLNDSVLNIVRSELCGDRTYGIVGIPGDPEIIPTC